MEILLPYKLYWEPPQPSIHPRLQIPILYEDSKITTTYSHSNSIPNLGLTKQTRQKSNSHTSNLSSS